MSRLERIKDWEERARLAHFNATELASLCMISYSQLRRYFLQWHGEPPQEWMKKIRLRLAAELLHASNLSVKDIARDLCFADESHFCHHFKNFFGCTPSEFESEACAVQGITATRPQDLAKERK